MKVFNCVMKIVAALAAVAGAVYVIATYGDKIVAWAKGLMGKCCCCADCECADCECNEDGACTCELDCETCECSDCDAEAEEAEETEAVEEPAAEEVTEEPAACEASDKDFEA